MSDIVVDHGGALDLAATLWRLADDLVAMAGDRERAPVDATASGPPAWTGRARR